LVRSVLEAADAEPATSVNTVAGFKFFASAPPDAVGTYRGGGR
jgi:hypothetical protein